MTSKKAALYTPKCRTLMRKNIFNLFEKQKQHKHAQDLRKIGKNDKSLCEKRLTS